MKIKTKLIEAPWRGKIGPAEQAILMLSGDAGSGGWGNGYIGLPLEHPWFEMDYDDIPADVHGGLTFAGHMDDDDLWWIGFDTMHCYDDESNWPKEAVRKETMRLKKMAEKVVNKEE